MAEFEDINQNINLKYTTNADDTAKEVVKLDDAQESVTRSTQANTKATKENTESQKSFKAQIREATQDLLKVSQQYGETSKEAVEAAKKVAQLKDQMGFANDLVEGFNPDRKFQSMATAVNAAAVATSGITSGMALFGAENAETEKTLLKVQAAMAFSDSIGRITELTDDFQKLKAQVVSTFTALTTSKAVDTTATEINTATNIKNTAAKEAGAVGSTLMAGGFTIQTVATTAATIATNILNASLAVLLSPITLVIAAIAGLVAGIAYLSGAIGDFSGEAAAAEKANLKLSKEIDNLAKSSKKANEETKFHNENQIAMAKASGASAEAIRKLKEELINQEVAEKNLNVQKARSIFLDARRIASSEDATDAQKETAKRAYEEFKNQNEIYEDSVKERRKLNAQNRIEVRQEETDRRKEIEEKEKEHLKKLQDERNKAAEEKRKKAQEAREKDAADLKRALDEQRKNEADGLKAITDEIDVAREKNNAFKLSAQEKELQDVNDKYFGLIEKAKQFGLDTNELEIAQLNEQNEINLKYGKEEEERRQTEAEKQIALEKTIADAKKEIQDAQVNNIERGVALLGSFAGKNKKLQAAAIIAENAVGVAKSIIASNAAIPAINLKYAAVPGGQALAASEIVANKISTGISIATSIAATAKALSALGGGGSAGSSGGGQSASSPSASGTPSVGFQNSTENQIANQVTNGINTQEPVKAFVVSNEVTTAQSLDRNKIEANSI